MSNDPRDLREANLIILGCVVLALLIALLACRAPEAAMIPDRQRAAMRARRSVPICGSADRVPAYAALVVSVGADLAVALDAVDALVAENAQLKGRWQDS